MYLNILIHNNQSAIFFGYEKKQKCLEFKVMIRPIQIFLIFIFGQVAFAQSQWVCDTIFKSSNYGCDNLSGSNTTGGSYPLLTDAFNINPASIPTTKTPVGVEMFWDESKTNFALIKGNGKSGAGFSSSSTQGPFFSNANNVDISNMRTNSTTRSTYTDSSGAYAPNLNFGSALNLLSSSPLTSNLGGQLKYVNKVNEIRPGFGWNFKTRFLNGGFSYYKSPTIGALTSASLGMKLFNFIADITYLQNQYGDPNRTLISSATLVWKKFIFTYAYRVQSDAYLTQSEIAQLSAPGSKYSKYHQMFGANFRPFDKLSIGFYQNYIIGKGSSFLIQYFF